ncbi:DIS3-like exonuclease 1 [Maylandia zebra]|uniref:DIS3-like exonuclease 1 n=1 Tax=Maylandia zebra TaxID=106582 RepID=UPI00403D1B97
MHVLADQHSLQLLCHVRSIFPFQVGAQLDEERNITALVPRQPLEVHETVAECMIYANHWVARKIQEAFPNQALLRCHPPPQQELFNQLVDTAKAKGFTIDTRSNKALAASLDRAVDPQDPLVNRLFRMMATTAMSQALYFSTGAHPQDQYYHYGLALDRYTHFTSPIRRYADIVVHRLLTAALHMQRGVVSGKAPASNKEVEEMAHHVNSKNRAAQAAQMRSTALFQCLFFRERDPQTDPCCVADAVVYSIRDNGVLVFIPEYGVRGPVYLKNKEGLVVVAGQDGSCDWQGGTVRKYPDRITTTSSCGTSTFKLFDHITVRISVHSSTCHADRLNLEVISNKPHHSAKSQQPSPQGRSQLVKEVVRQNEEALAQEKTARRPKLSKEEREFRQSKTPSLYSILEEIRELALMDLERASRLPATTA